MAISGKRGSPGDSGSMRMIGLVCHIHHNQRSRPNRTDVRVTCQGRREKAVGSLRQSSGCFQDEQSPECESTEHSFLKKKHTLTL